MTEEDLKSLWYYVIRADDGDRYYREVYADDELMYIETTKEKAYDRLMTLCKFVVGEDILSSYQNKWTKQQKLSYDY